MKIKSKKIFTLHYILNSIFIIVGLIPLLIVEKDNLWLLTQSMFILSLANIGVFSKLTNRIPYLEIGGILTSIIVLFVEKNHYDYAVFLSFINFLFIVMDVFIFLMKKRSTLPYGVFHKIGFVIYKIILFLLLFIGIYLYTKITNYLLLTIFYLLILVSVILGFYLIELAIYRKKKNDIYKGKQVNINYDVSILHPQTQTMYHILQVINNLAKGYFLEATKAFDQIYDINFYERLDYNRINILLTALVYSDYKKTVKVIEKSEEFTRYYKNKKSRKFVKKLYEEYKKYVDIYFDKVNKYELELIRNNLLDLRLHNLFSALFYLKKNNKEKSQEFLTQINILTVFDKTILYN